MYALMHVLQALPVVVLTAVLVGCVGIPATRHSTDPATSRIADSCAGVLAEASALMADFADSSAARVAAAHAAYAARMAHYHSCLAEHRSPS
jgi:hypothetical protein